MAHVMALGSNSSPFAVGFPAHSSPYQEAVTVTDGVGGFGYGRVTIQPKMHAPIIIVISIFIVLYS
jgi:hypothetical protein